MMNKILIIPAMFLASGLVLTGCTNSSPAPEPTNTSDTTDDVALEDLPEEIDVPDNADTRYDLFTTVFQTVPAENFEYYQSIGAKTYAEDSAVRTVDYKQWEQAKNSSSYEALDRIYGEIISDVETSALNVSTYLTENPEATLENIPANELLKNRYTTLLGFDLEQDVNTKFYYVMADGANGEEDLVFGQVVPQEGITPEGLMMEETLLQ